MDNEPVTPAPPRAAGMPEAVHLRDLTAHQWKSGIAAWLGWLFDGLDIFLYVLVAAPFVAELIHADKTSDPLVARYSSWIQAAFLIGWALGGSFFGRIADKLGRSRALNLTILTYAVFTGLSFFAQEWWHLMIFRFLAALGIGGEWAVGSALLSETWPRRWRPWMAAVLQTGVNLGFMLAALATTIFAGYHRHVFLVGILPAFLTLWIRYAVPETEEWEHARKSNRELPPDAQARVGFADLFRGPVLRITLLTLVVCALSLSAHWAFTFWQVQHIQNLPEVQNLDEASRRRLVSQMVGQMTWLLMLVSIAGNFLAAFIARSIGYRRAIALLCVAYFVSIAMTFYEPLDYRHLRYGYVAIGLCQGVFALFTMYLPPLFPTLLRTTGAGFCYNIGRIAAAFGTVFFGLFTEIGDSRLAIFYSGFLFVPAAIVAWLLPELPNENAAPPAGPAE